MIRSYSSEYFHVYIYVGSKTSRNCLLIWTHWRGILKKTTPFLHNTHIKIVTSDEPNENRAILHDNFNINNTARVRNFGNLKNTFFVPVYRILKNLGIGCTIGNLSDIKIFFNLLDISIPWFVQVKPDTIAPHWIKLYFLLWFELYVSWTKIGKVGDCGACCCTIKQ